MLFIGEPKDKKIKKEQVYWKLQEWVRELLWKYDSCIVCGSEENLEPHHIIRCDKTNPLYFLEENGIVMCHRCHNLYHNNYDEINFYTFIKFFEKYHYKLSKKIMKKKKRNSY